MLVSHSLGKLQALWTISLVFPETLVIMMALDEDESSQRRIQSCTFSATHRVMCTEVVVVALFVHNY